MLETANTAPTQENEVSSKELELISGIRGMGHVGLEATMDDPRAYAPLPEGYSYDRSEALKHEEIVDLMHKSETYKDTTAWDLERFDRFKDILGVTVFNVAVRSESGQLVGFGGLLYRGKNGHLGRFIVDPAHQGEGIGKAILDTRLAKAKELKLKSLYADKLAATNTLRTYYLQKGFRETQEGEMVRGRRPRSLTVM